MSARQAVATAMVLMLAVACDGAQPLDPGPAPPPVLAGAWHATHVRGRAMPDVLYLFDPDSIAGEEVSVHFIVDSSLVVMDTTGGYGHQLWVTQWVGEPGGPPLTRTLEFYHGDFGEWRQDGTVLEFESHWLVNHRMRGSFGTDGVLRMEHGFSHGDPPVEFRYGK